jgi:L-rhamnose mutarotase
MNAKELADVMEKYSTAGFMTPLASEFKEAATMLRQLQADYYSLLVNHDKLYAKVVEQQAEIELLKKEAALQRLSDFTQEVEKTLTDEEILKMAANMFHYSEYRLVIDFARAILKKAQEK